MQQIILQVPDNKFSFIMEMLKNFKFLKVKAQENEPSKNEILEGLKEAVEQVNLIKAGKLKSRPLKDLLDEL